MLTRRSKAVIALVAITALTQIPKDTYEHRSFVAGYGVALLSLTMLWAIWGIVNDA